MVNGDLWRRVEVMEDRLGRANGQAAVTCRINTNWDWDGGSPLPEGHFTLNISRGDDDESSDGGKVGT